MIAVDTNILVYATRAELKNHARALERVSELAEGNAPWALPWPCVYEYLKVVTHPRVFAPPTPMEVALNAVESLMDSPTVVMLGEGLAHRAQLRRFLERGDALGNLVHDAHIAALLFEHGVVELLTEDRDFSRFAGIRVRRLED